MTDKSGTHYHKYATRSEHNTSPPPVSSCRSPTAATMQRHDRAIIPNARLDTTTSWESIHHQADRNLKPPDTNPHPGTTEALTRTPPQKNPAMHRSAHRKKHAEAPHLPPTTPPPHPADLPDSTIELPTAPDTATPGSGGGNTRADGPGRDSAPAPEPGTGSDAGSTGPAIAADAPPVPARATSGRAFRGQFDDGVRLALRRSRADSAVRRRALRAADGLVTILICGRRRRRVVLLAGLPFARFPVP